MASIGNQILIKMGLDSSQLEKGLNQSKQEIKATGQAIDAMGAKWKATASMLTRTVIAPIAGFMSLGAVIKSYFSGVAQVAQLTGAYSQKMEEWRKKRAMLARYNREDIELYKKGREAVVKFQITMDDLSAKIMRSVSPAIKWLIDRLNDFSNWIDRNSQNIIRFFSVVAGVITAILIPAFLKLAVAMLTNPLTWIIGLIGLLILVIDDLVTYLRGGESALGAFWKPLIEYTKIAWEWITKFFNAFTQSEGVKAIIAITHNWWTHLANGLKQLWDLTVRWFNLWNEKTNNFKGIVEAFKGVFQTIWGLFETLEAIVAGVFGAIVALFTGDTTMLKNAWKLLCDGLENTFKGAFKIIEGVIIHVKGVFDVLKEVINKIVDAVMNFGSALKNALNIDGLIEKVKSGLSNILPDWVKSTLGINTENGSDSQPTIYAGTDAPIVPDVASMQTMQAQSKGNSNTNISREQNFYINTNSPAV
ncbi:hypothetical protein, partial [Succinivibrio sp.]|uniref:phage tail protein n=1 Tax=Succinivibrio sp. TaxID=2053619 RepID=UPI00386EA7A1